MGLTQQDMHDKIIAYLNNNYYKAFKSSDGDENKFKNYMESHITSEYQKSITKENEFYQSELQNIVERFLRDKENNKSLDYLKEFKNKNDEIKQMNDLIDNYFLEMVRKINQAENSGDNNDNKKNNDDNNNKDTKEILSNQMEEIKQSSKILRKVKVFKLLLLRMEMIKRNTTKI
jgi:hypothetical protein